MSASNLDATGNAARCGTLSRLASPPWDDSDSDSGEYDFIRDTRPVSAPPPPTAPTSTPPLLFDPPHPVNKSVRPSTVLGIQSVSASADVIEQRNIATLAASVQTGSQQVTFRVVFMGQGKESHKTIVRRAIAEGLVEMRQQKSSRTLSMKEQKYNVVVQEAYKGDLVKVHQDDGMHIVEADFTWLRPGKVHGIPSMYEDVFNWLAVPPSRSDNIIAYLDSHTHPFKRLWHSLQNKKDPSSIDMIVYFFGSTEISSLEYETDQDMQVLSKMRALDIPVLPLLTFQKGSPRGNHVFVDWLQRYNVPVLSLTGIRPESPTFTAPQFFDPVEIMQIGQLAAIQKADLGRIFEPLQRPTPTKRYLGLKQGIVGLVLLTLVPLLIISVLGWYFADRAPALSRFTSSPIPQVSLINSSLDPFISFSLRASPFDQDPPPVNVRLQLGWCFPDEFLDHRFQLQLAYARPEQLTIILSSNGVKLGESPVYTSNPAFFTAANLSPCALGTQTNMSAIVMISGLDSVLYNHPITLRWEASIDDQELSTAMCPFKDGRDVAMWQGTNIIMVWVQWIFDIIYRWHVWT